MKPHTPHTTTKRKDTRKYHYGKWNTTGGNKINTTTVEGERMNKPSKKTEWEERIHHILSLAWDGGWKAGMNRELDACYAGTEESTRKVMEIFHQRDNEIREKIQGMKKENNALQGTPEAFEIYYTNKVADDLLTYLSNRNGTNK